MARRKRVVTITGANGFIGRHLVGRLLQEPGLRLRCLVREHSDISSLEPFSEAIELVVADITQPQTLQAAFEGSWGVVNLAGCREFWS